MKLKLIAVIIFNIAIILFELLFAFISNSNSLYADAFHNASDVLALVVSFIALIYKNKNTTYNSTYGYLRAEMLAAFVNSCFLIVTTLYIFIQAIFSWVQGYEVQPVTIIVVASVALVGNTLSSLLLYQKEGGHHHHHHTHSHSHQHHHAPGAQRDMNIHAAFLHMFADALISFIVILGGVAIYFLGLYWIDAVASLLISLYIVYITYPTLKKSFQSLMDMNMRNVQPIIDLFLSFDEVASIHHFHIYQPASNHCFITVHLVLEDTYTAKSKLSDIEKLITAIRAKLAQFNVTHLVIQPETSKFYDKNIISNCFEK